MLSAEIMSKLKNTTEQKTVVGPLIAHLIKSGWKLEQIIFGKSEWRVPKSPSEATKREKKQSFSGFPVDVAVFDDPTTVGDPRHLLFIIECKQETETAGVSQLESYFVGEPYVQLGAWINNATPSAQAVFLYRKADGRILLKRQKTGDLPRAGEAIKPETQRLTFNDLIAPTEVILKKTMEDLLDKIVIGDSNVTRREEQLDQLCNVLLLKLESDKQGKSEVSAPVFFRPLESPAKTASAIRDRYESFVELYPEVFLTEQDKTLRFSNATIASCVEVLSGLKLIDLGVSTISLAFQVLRSEALKQGEGQYFTPQAVITAGVRLMKIQFQDIVLDPACGTGGFLVEAMLEMQRTHSTMSPQELSRWAQTHIFGVEKDAIGVKLTKAIMQIAGDGSAHCVRGDSIRKHDWSRDFPHLNHGSFKNGRFSVIVTNPPFGQNLKVSAEDSRLSLLEIAKRGDDNYSDLEIGLLFLDRAYQWLKVGGRLGIVLPETYFFSSNYLFLFEWMKPRFKPLVIANIPMEAFQGFCRAKTNFYVFEKIG
jgi:type I restriction enzyme M protein